MKKLIFMITCMLFLQACTKEQLDQVLKTNSSLTNEEVIQGLRAALNVSTDTSVTVLNKLDGYFKDEAVKILLPPEALVMYNNISKIPGGGALITELMDNTILAMNRAAEDAAKEAKPIFINAITGITIADGFSILNGSDTAATVYLKDKTDTALFNAFQPKINVSLSKPIVFNLSAEESYSKLINAYNTASFNGVLFDKVTTNSLSEHVTRKGLNGLFLKVAEQEKNIRKDPFAQVTDILKKVFGNKTN